MGISGFSGSFIYYLFQVFLESGEAQLIEFEK